MKTPPVSGPAACQRPFFGRENNAPGQSTSTPSIGGAASSSRSKRPRCAALASEVATLSCSTRGPCWGSLTSTTHDAAKGQELKDLTDLRHRKRGELAQIQRLKANWQLYEREALAAEAGEPGMLVAREIARVPARARRASHLEGPVARRSDVRRHQGTTRALSAKRCHAARRRF